MPTVFTSIIKGDLPSHPIWRDDECAAFLSINPITDGHCLVVPIQEVDHWIDVPLSTTGRLLEVASLIGRSQMEAFQPNRICLLYTSPSPRDGLLSRMPSSA